MEQQEAEAEDVEAELQEIRERNHAWMRRNAPRKRNEPNGEDRRFLLEYIDKLEVEVRAQLDEIHADLKACRQALRDAWVARDQESESSIVVELREEIRRLRNAESARESTRRQNQERKSTRKKDAGKSSKAT